MFRNKWQKFLDSLATNGGNLFLLAFFSVVLLGVSVFLMIKFGPAHAAVTLVVGSFGTFTGALVGILRGSRSDSAPQTGEK